ncbi:MAG: hypothetical protein H6732_05475 [Alphaproteobacteria bacterium]|nr:hypothetical protein [Alphaproteobacteria bacterium]
MTRTPSGTPPAEGARLARLAELGMQSAVLLHELRQPLFALKATAELVLAGRHPEGPTGDEAAWRQVVEQVSQIEQLIGRYGQGGGVHPEVVARVDLGASVRAALDVQLGRAAGVDVALRSRLPGDPVWVRGDDGALRQVVHNLVQNALDAVEGGPRREVWVELARVDEHAVIEVRDSGAGIAPELLPRVFEPFVTTKAPGRGTGLGLFVTRALVTEAGGRLELETGATGTTLRVLLPTTS